VAAIVSELAYCRVAEQSDGKTPWRTWFLCDTILVPIESRVDEFVPHSRIVRFGDGIAINAYHTVFLLKTDQGCGNATGGICQLARRSRAVEFRNRQPNAIDAGHDLWLSTP
jgi:hypothetical protein